MANNWTSRKSEDVIEYRRKEFELLLNFANTDMNLEESEDLGTEILHRLSHHQALHPENQDREPDEKMAGEIINNLQRHLRSRFKDIYTKATLVWWDQLWSGATTKFIIDPREGHFRESFNYKR